MPKKKKGIQFLFLYTYSPYAGKVDFPEAAADGNKGLAAPFGPVG